MKGLLEEYGTFVFTAIITLIVVSFLINSATSPEGVIHRFAVVNMENMGAESQVVLKEWKIGSITATLKDDGGLRLSGTGTLPNYGSVEDTPWALEAGNIDFVRIEDSVTVSGDVPIK